MLQPRENREAGHDVQHADETDFIAALEQDCHGRLAPITGRLARTALAKVVDVEIDKITNEALASIGGTHKLDVGEGCES